MTSDSQPATRRAPLPPRWFIRAAWKVHRAIYARSKGRRGLGPATDTKWGTMALRTVGRRTGQERVAILGYYWDGPNLVTLAMNGWGAPEPAWWLNLQARPETTVQLHDRTLRVRGRAAAGEERERLWNRWRTYDGGNLDSWASRRPGETAVVVLEPLE